MYDAGIALPKYVSVPHEHHFLHLAEFVVRGDTNAVPHLCCIVVPPATRPSVRGLLFEDPREASPVAMYGHRHATHYYSGRLER